MGGSLSLIPTAKGEEKGVGVERHYRIRVKHHKRPGEGQRARDEALVLACGPGRLALPDASHCACQTIAGDGHDYCLGDHHAETAYTVTSTTTVLKTITLRQVNAPVPQSSRTAKVS